MAKTLLPLTISGAGALLLLTFLLGFTSLVSPRVLVSVCVAVISGLWRPSFPRWVFASQQLWWCVLGSLSFILGCLDLLWYAWDGTDALQHLTLTRGIVVEVLMAFLYAASMRGGGASKKASSARRALVAVALSYRAVVLISPPPPPPPPPLWVVAAFASLLGISVMSIFSVRG